jgi:hydroxymethylpyrimidine kinase/phosphomethylpyrimidine kinase
MSRPVALTLAGADPSGGAGLQADLKTFAAHGVYGLSVTTVLTAQNARRCELLPVPGEFIRKQAEALFEEHDIRAIKIGVLAGRDGVEAVVDILQQHNADRRIPVVLDPILRASTGDKALADDGFVPLRDRLLPLADLIKPNLMEAARLANVAPATTLDELQRQAARVRALGGVAVLLSGGHLAREEATDVLATAAGMRLLPAPRHPGGDVHGTGCTLTAAIAANLARGDDLTAAVDKAKVFIGTLFGREPQLNRAAQAISFDHLGGGKGEG